MSDQVFCFYPGTPAMSSAGNRSVGLLQSRQENPGKKTCSNRPHIHYSLHMDERY